MRSTFLTRRTGAESRLETGDSNARSCETQSGNETTGYLSDPSVGCVDSTPHLRRMSPPLPPEWVVRKE
jgi:hypothetical protein